MSPEEFRRECEQLESVTLIDRLRYWAERAGAQSESDKVKPDVGASIIAEILKQRIP